MALKERLHRQLVNARQLSERLLADFTTPEQWTTQVHACANHALWFAGHMGISDNFFLTIIAPALARPRPDLEEKFGIGSQPTNRPADYPPVPTVLDYMQERRQTLLAHLDSLTEDDLQTATPDGSPDFLPDVASVFEMAIWHEGMHSGQITVVRRALGKPPLV